MFLLLFCFRFVSDTYDVITGCGVFIPNHITEESFDELNRILKPGKKVKQRKSFFLIVKETCYFIPRLSNRWKLIYRTNDRVKGPGDNGSFFELFSLN